MFHKYFIMAFSVTEEFHPFIVEVKPASPMKPELTGHLVANALYVPC